MPKTYQIGELARQADVPVETVRYYESLKLLPKPGRAANNYRQYTQVHLERLSFIRHCRSLDMSIDEIRQLLRVRDRPEADCAEVNAVLDEHIEHVGQKLAELQRLKRQLIALRERCQTASRGADCGILAGLAETQSLGPERPRDGHRKRSVHRD
jgi:Cd(II)/Pb(II)-responsive transcriptional regulator